MQYNIDRDNYCRIDVMKQNKLPARSYYIPFSTRELADNADILTKRYISDKVQCLNGIWDFKFYPQPAQVMPPSMMFPTTDTMENPTVI